MIKISVQTTKQEKSIGKKAKAAGTKIGTSIRKAFALAGKTLKKRGAAPEKLENDSTTKEAETLSPESANERSIDSYDEESPLLSPQRINPQIGEGNETKGDTKSVAEKQVADDFELECLTCENLIHCEIRSASPSKWKEQTKNGESCLLSHMR